jgi:hypothetical protein
MLPEKWKIKLTKDNLNTVGAFYDSICHQANCYSSGEYIYKFLSSHNNEDEKPHILEKGGRDNGKHHANFRTTADVPEITTEQFIKYIINREIPVSYEIY